MYFYRNTFFFSGYLYINLFLNNQQAMVFGGRGWGRQNKVHVPFCFFWRPGSKIAIPVSFPNPSNSTVNSIRRAARDAEWSSFSEVVDRV